MDRKRIIGNGWRQGACLYVKDLPAPQQEDLTSKGFSGTDLLIVTSQSCDVVMESLETEPFIEFIKATPYSDTSSELHNNTFTNAKHSRCLQLDAPDFTDHTFLHLFIHDRITLGREFIGSNSMDLTQCLTGKELQTLKTWLAARYNRASFPDKFYEWAKNGIEKMEGRLDKQVGDEHACIYVEGIYMRVEPDEEVNDSDSYDLYCFALISPQTPIAAFEKIKQAMQDLVSGVNPEKIMMQTEDSLVMQTTEITVAELIGYKKFYFDFLSLKRGEKLAPGMD